MDRRSTTPTKKLVPTVSSEEPCKHAFSHDGGLILEVDCATCSGAQDLNNGKCVAGIVNILASGVVPDTIVLKRHIHIRHRADSISWLLSLATCMASSRRMQESGSGPSDSRCRTCPASRERVASLLVAKIREDPMTFPTQEAALSDMLLEMLQSVDCPDAPRCARDAARILNLEGDGG
jgi:hypothetical protein